MKKILAVKNLHVLLPDDFNGTFEDALQFIVDYRRSSEGNAQLVRYLESEQAMMCNEQDCLPSDKREELMWSQFQQAVNEGKRMHGRYMIASWNGESWDDISREEDEK